MKIYPINKGTVSRYNTASIIYQTEDKSLSRDFYFGTSKNHYMLCPCCKKNVVKDMKCINKTFITEGFHLCDKCWGKRINEKYKSYVKYGFPRNNKDNCVQERLRIMDAVKELDIISKKMFLNKNIERIIKLAENRVKNNEVGEWRIRLNFLNKYYKIFKIKEVKHNFKIKEIESNIYIMFDGRYYKIGKSNNVSRRLSQLKTGNPKITVIYFKYIKDVFYIEKLLHKKFKDKHIGGEWFCLNESELKSTINFINNLE